MKLENHWFQSPGCEATGLYLHSIFSLERLKEATEGAIVICGVAFILKLTVCASKQFSDSCPVISPGHGTVLLGLSEPELYFFLR